MATKPFLHAADADRIVVAARNAARAVGAAVTIAITDDGGHLLRLDRLDRAPLVSIRVAIGKAHTAVHMGMSSRAVQDYTAQLPSMVAIPGIFPFTGGLPLMEDGFCVGAIGVSGAAPEQDESVAQAGALALAR